MIKIAALGGSLRPHSSVYQALELALKKIEMPEVETDLIDLRTLNLPFCTGANDYPDYPDVERFRQRIQSANGLLLASPEYHGNISGVLKNALDLLDERHLAGKMVGLMVVMGGSPSTNALNAMRLICRQLHCWVLPEQVIIPYASESFDDQGGLKDPILEDRLEHFVRHLIKAVHQWNK